jgi:hypothetical protein
MSKSNPESSLNALFPEPIDCGFGVSVYPLTLAHYALLEKINSYLVNGDHAPDSIEVIKTLYICTHSAKETMVNFDSLEHDAFEWAEHLPPPANNIIVNAILKQIATMSKVIPVIGDDDKKKLEAETDF